MAVYKVLDPLALRIGGKRIRAGATVELSDIEAEHELRIGSFAEYALGVSDVDEPAPAGWNAVAEANSASLEGAMRGRKDPK